MRNSQRLSRGRITLGALAITLCLTALSRASAVVSFSAPYASTADSTLNPLSPTYHVDNFESGAVTLPGVIYSAIGTSGVTSGSSVDADDGVIDGSGVNGKSFDSITQASANNVTFFFSQIGGQWPRQVAVAVSGGFANNVEFVSYDPASNPSGSLLIPTISVPTAANAFLVTFTDNNGISAINMQTASGGLTDLHYDHLQFDTAVVSPEPASIAIIVLAAGALALRRKAALRALV